MCCSLPRRDMAASRARRGPRRRPASRAALHGDGTAGRRRRHPWRHPIRAPAVPIRPAAQATPAASAWAAAAARAEGPETPILRYRLETWRSTVRTLSTRPSGDRVVVQAAPDQPQDLALAARQDGLAGGRAGSAPSRRSTAAARPASPGRPAQQQVARRRGLLDRRAPPVGGQQRLGQGQAGARGLHEPAGALEAAGGVLEARPRPRPDGPRRPARAPRPGGPRPRRRRCRWRRRPRAAARPAPARASVVAPGPQVRPHDQLQAGHALAPSVLAAPAQVALGPLSAPAASPRSRASSARASSATVWVPARAQRLLGLVQAALPAPQLAQARERVGRRGTG